MPVVLPNAVMIKPAGEQVVNEEKLFRDEDDFLSIESSLNSSDVMSEHSLTGKNSEEEEDEQDVHTNKQRSYSFRDSLFAHKSTIFSLSQVEDGTNPKDVKELDNDED